VLRRIGEEAAPTAAPARAAGALGAATMGAQSEPMTVAAPEIPRAPLPADDAAIARDLLQRGMSPQEVASILGDPSMDVVAMLSR
jgi:outer membrane protein assembly factor BamE (lipoprotein component of BamABCDE complex)